MSRDIKYIGMDVHKEATVIAVLNGSGKLVIESIVETQASSILQFISNQLPMRPRNRTPTTITTTRTSAEYRANLQIIIRCSFISSVPRLRGAPDLPVPFGNWPAHGNSSLHNPERQ